VIRTVAGTGLQWDKGDGGPAIGACVVHVEAVAHGPGDDLYLGDAVGRIRRIDARTGIIATVAGCGVPGYSGDGGPATAARIGAPTAIRFDRAGNLFFADRAHHVVRRVDAQSGRITTMAGLGRPGFSPDGTPAQQALLDTPWGLELGPDGAIYVADARNNRVRRLWPGGALETVAGGDGGPRLNEPHGLRLYGDGVLLVSDHFANRVLAVPVPVV
jgi:serine/threonine-protein kinase